MSDWKDIPLPKKMQALQRDRRGYPVPFIVMRDLDNKPHFAINDTGRHEKALFEKRCPVCGTRIGNGGTLWFVGGPLSAFHPDGAYMDSAMHHECMTYALQVCPYLAMPQYLRRVDAGTVNPERLPGRAIFLDATQDPDRPLLFVAVAAKGQKILPKAFGCSTVRPCRPYLAVEYWRHGRRLPDAEGVALATQAIARAAR